MTHAYDLSFCIPTYNFGAFIGATLDSILCQADDRIQIVIVDGGSTDDTAKIVAEKTRQFPHIKFIQRQQRCGVDRDILESVAQADGEYCWLFSADDLLEPDAVAFVRGQMRDGWDVFLTNFGLCDLHMNRLFRHEILAVEELSTFDWNQPAERTRFLELAQSTTAFFSFISGIVVNRASWNRVPQQTDFIGTCWIIAAQLFALSRQGLVVRYYPGELLQKRGDNDSFMAGGMIKRMGLSINGFRDIAERFFGKGSPEALSISRVLKNEMPFLLLNHMRLRTDDPQELAGLDA
ncbi:MAG: glycosyltransferase family 2 protein, partial [Planctomycetota bacterium]|nr:glycosyltransferase family 2 protein [Planctomycetota bacterium]